MTWLFIGSSASAPDYLPVARKNHRIDRTVTCNSGILLEPKPDVYFLIDAKACVDHREHAVQAAERGVHCVTLLRKRDALEQRCVDWFHEFLDLPERGEPTATTWGEFHYSGPTCMEYALRNGAITLVLVGCDGYTGERDYFTEKEITKCPKPLIRDRMTRCVLEKRQQSLADVFPGVAFIQYGDPIYAIHGDNWRVERDRGGDHPGPQGEQAAAG